MLKFIIGGKMKKCLNEEYVIKRRMWVILLDILIETIIFSIILYFCVTKYNNNIVQMLNFISTNNFGLSFVKLSIPIILIIVCMIKFSSYIISKENVDKNLKRKKIN